MGGASDETVEDGDPSCGELLEKSLEGESLRTEAMMEAVGERGLLVSTAGVVKVGIIP